MCVVFQSWRKQASVIIAASLITSSSPLQPHSFNSSFLFTSLSPSLSLSLLSPLSSFPSPLPPSLKQFCPNCSSAHKLMRKAKKGKEGWRMGKETGNSLIFKKTRENKKRQREIFFARTLRERCQLPASAKRKRNISSFSFFLY